MRLGQIALVVVIVVVVLLVLGVVTIR